MPKKIVRKNRQNTAEVNNTTASRITENKANSEFLELKQKLEGDFSANVRALQERHQAELRTSSTSKFNRFNSPLRFFNSTTHNSNNCYRGLVLGPLFNYI